MSTIRNANTGGHPTDVIPGPQQPWHMSMPELAVALSLHEPGTPRAAAVEEELRRRLLRDEDAAPRTPPAVAFLMGALVAITAIQVGAVMRAAPNHAPRAAAPAAHMSQQVPAMPAALRKA